MLPPDVVTVECDRCRRPVARLIWRSDGLGERVALEGMRLADDSRAYVGARPDRYALSGGRPGAFVIDADNPTAPTDRATLVCHGRKHPRYARVTTDASRTRAYQRAIAAGRQRIGMREII